ncbi:ATP-dependent protease ClpP, protease subunit [Anaerocolumna xylanovorans DSM 12503]|uniref:ATP-dependent protease ClpP, protease subunit n=1 Tax=Anaerocolumna xylanovorans DSM 12503 TaxID=1121345 RepID=A0A1M7YC38_9FIRM|nr:ATP-dependent protease ClpP, protease subunit [Anaerocolumna xylanovorans DSM 12503]
MNALGKKDTINVLIQSGGGDVFAANAIKTALETNSAKITGTIIGLCASAATIVLTACDVRRIANNGLLMAHNPKVTLYGAYESKELSKLAEVTDKVKQSIINAYMQILNKTEEEVTQLMDDESWYVGQEAIDAGFCNELIAGESFQNNALGDHKNFMVNGKNYNFTNYIEAVVPDNIRKKVLNLSRTPQKEEGAFFNTSNQKGNENMGDFNNQTATPATPTAPATPAIVDVVQLRNAYPEFCNAIAEEAVKAERERLKAIDAVAKGIPDDVLNKAKYDEPMSAQDLAYAQMVANNAAGQQTMTNVVDDLKNSGAGEVGSVPNVGNDTTGQKKEEKEAKVHGFANALKGDKRRGTK